MPILPLADPHMHIIRYPIMRKLPGLYKIITVLIAMSLFNTESTAGWLFGPNSYAECMKEELNKAQNNIASTPYIRDYCYNEHCEGKGEWASVENPTADRCKALTPLLKESDKVACRGYPHGADAGYGGDKSNGVSCENRPLSDREQLDCKCTRWKKYSHEFSILNCSSLVKKIFIHDDKTCPH